MCGIVGAVAERNVVPILMEGLRRLEYRGYDSAGIAIHGDAGITRVRRVGKVQELQSRVNDAQQKLRELETTVEVGGGMVAVTINGKQEIKKIKIEKSVVSPDDIELLEDLILSAVNKAVDQSQKMAKDEMGKATSGMIPNIPGLDLGNLGM